jgi:putative tricarboxylic transport membrane protein
MKLRQALPYAVMLAASAALYWAATRIDVDTGGRIGPAVWPRTIIVILALLCVYEIVKRLVAGSGSSAQGLIGELQERPAGEAQEVVVPPPAFHGRKLAGGIALVAAYVVAVPWLGFFVTTALFLAVFPWLGGLRRPVLAATLGVAGSFVLVVIFMRVAYISLPFGEGPFRALTFALLRAIGVS